MHNTSFGGMPIPDIHVVNKDYVSTERELLMLAFAFMHCTIFDGEGDIEFAKDGVSMDGIQRNNVPDDFQSFYAVYRKSGASSFHARCKAMDITSPFGTSEFTLISSGYSFPYTMVCGPNGIAVFHPGMVQNKALHKKIMDETFALYEKVKQGLPIPPAKEKENEHPIKCYDARKYQEKYEAKPSDFSAPEGFNTLCNRTSFKFTCLKSIQCCGQCEMLEKSYQMLVSEALAEESAAKLKQMVEEAGLFSKDEKGEPSTCHGCKCGVCGTNESACPESVFKAVEAIRSLWVTCYTPQILAQK